MIVVGLNFGDEGKGLTTSFLCSQTENPIVVRFNGGQQAGHTVIYGNKRHVFSGFGSGSLQGVPTYWSPYCTFYPNSFVREWELLDNPLIYVNPLCPVTTPFDIDHNRNQARKTNHGSVGMGFGSTIQRHQDNFKLFVQDLFYENVLLEKLKSIADYYNAIDVEEQIEQFLLAVRKVKEIIHVHDDSILHSFTPIFEGAQGILLDMDFGFFPNVTRSSTTSKNALQISGSEEIYYVTRTYLTRHGNGFLPDEQELNLINNENETNKSHPYQGEFRTAKLNIELLNYSLDCDDNFSHFMRKNLVITCADQYQIDVDKLLSQLTIKFDKVYISNGDSLSNITLWKKRQKNLSYQLQ